MKLVKLFIHILLLAATSLCAQRKNSALTVQLSDYEGNVNFLKNKICLNLFLNDTLVNTRCFYNTMNTRFTKLKPGKYELGIIVDNVKKYTIHAIDVDSFYVSELRISLANFSYGLKTEYVSDSSEVEHNEYVHPNSGYFIMNLLKGLPTDNKTVFIDNEIQFSMVWGFPMVKSRHFDVPFEFGFNTGFVHINRDTTLFSVKPKTNERYFYLNFSLALLNSIKLLNDSASNKPSLLIQYGAGYNFPFVYNHVGIDGSTRQTQQSISNYNNVYLVGRIAYGHHAKFGIEAQYNLNPHLNKKYPQPAYLKVGLFLAQSF